MLNSIQNGRPWYDTKGERIQAHGGSVMYLDGYYYFYGENKEKTTGKDDTWQWGMRYYRSRDLYNWEDMGLFVAPDLTDPKSPLHPTAFADRPHIIYNKKTKKFVCWIKVMIQGGTTQQSTVLTSDSFGGPYTVVRTGLMPLDMSAGDFDLVVDEETGKAYYYFERVHDATICAELTEDYTDVNGVYSLHFPHPEGAPYVREATAHFLRNGKHYLITSGTTGYYPNPSEVAIGDDYHGPFTVLGDPHVGDESHTSFHSQISSVFKVPGKKDLYIACADRWMPGYEKFSYEDILKLRSLKKEKKYDEMEKMMEEFGAPKYFSTATTNTSLAEYIWLPLRFEGENVYIDWKEEWRIEDYE